MDDRQLGTTIRVLRVRRGWRHQDLADRASTSRWTIGRIESGRLGSVRLETLRRVADALDAGLALQLRWRGGDLQRLVNARHSAFHEVVARRFAQLPDWMAVPEASFSVYGERGFVDILAYHEVGGSSWWSSSRRRSSTSRSCSGTSTGSVGWLPDWRGIAAGTLRGRPSGSQSRRAAPTDDMSRRTRPCWEPPCRIHRGASPTGSATRRIRRSPPSAS